MDTPRLKILVIDDEPQIRRLLQVALTAYPYEVVEAADGKEGIAQTAATRPDLVLVDLGLPDMDGKEVVQAIRQWSNVPIIILTAREQEEEKITALDVGADDYVTKPFSTGELMARIRVCLRRSAVEEKTDTTLTCGGIRMDLAKYEVTVDGREVKLTPTEFDLLKVLMQYAGRVLTHKQLLQAVWGKQYDNDLHYIRIYMRQLRRKIEENPAEPKYLITETGIGYRLTSEEPRK